MSRRKIIYTSILSIAVLTCACFTLGGYGESGPDSAPNLEEHGLVGYWNFEEGSGQTVYDRSGNSNNGTLGANSSIGKDDPVFTSGHDSNGPGGTGMEFDGVDDYVDCGSGDILDFGAGAFSVQMWIKPSTISGNHGFLEKATSSSTVGFVLQQVGSDLYFYLNGTSTDIIVSNFFSVADIWYNVAVIRDSSGNLTVYKNSVSVGTGSDSGNVDVADNLLIGKNDGDYASNFNGSIDSVRIYNRALSADEIRQHYNQKKPILHLKMDEELGTIAYDESFNNNDGTVYGAAGTADSGTATTLTDTKTWTVDEWIGETVTIHTGTCSTVSRTITDNDATSITVSDWNACTPDATSQYRITSKDEWTTGKHASAIDFDGVDDYVDAGNGNSLNFGTGSFTIETWVRLNSLGTTGHIASKMNSAYNTGWSLQNENNNRLNLYISGASADIYCNNYFTDTNWVHVVAVRDTSGNLKIYKNGQIVFGCGGSGIDAQNINNTDTLKIGAKTGGSYPSYFKGSIDEARIYNYARTQDEILTDYNAGKAVHLGKNNQNENDGLVGYWNFEEGSGQTVYDRSGNSNNGTLGVNSSIGKDDPVFSSGYDSSGPGGTGMEFDGVDDYVEIQIGNNSLKPTNALTIEAWINPAQFSGANRYIVSRKLNYYLGYLLGGNFYLGAYDTSWHGVWGSNTPSLNEWHHIVGTVNTDTNEFKIYIDGELDSSDTVAMGQFADRSEETIIGNQESDGFTYPFDGSIDSVRIYNRALSADEIRMHYNQKKPIMHLKMDEGSGTIAYDESLNNNDGTIYGVQGTATGTHSTTTLQDTDKSWTADEWIGETATIYSGTCATVSQTITDNTTDTITVAAWGCTPDNTSVYKITSKDEWTTGKHASAINFDGVDDYVDITNSTSLNTTNLMTIGAWVNFTNDNKDARIIARIDDWQIYLDSTDGDLKFFRNAGGWGSYDSDYIPPIGEWTYIAITYDTSSANLINFYANGILKKSLAASGNIGTGGNTRVGHNSGSQYFNGSIDDVCIYNYARTQDEILTDYNAGKAAHLGKNNQEENDGLVGYWNFEENSGQTIYDRSGNSNNGTLGTNSSVGKDDPVFSSGYGSNGPGGTGMKFDGVDDYVDCGTDANCNGSGTLMVWVKADSWPGIVGIAAKGNSGNGNSISYGIWGFSTGKPKGYVANGSAYDSIEFNTVVTTGVWHQLAYTWDGSNLTTYLDGAFDKQESQDVTQTSNAQMLIMGAVYTGGWFFNGSIDSVRIYNRALSADEIRMHYNQKKPILYLKMDEGSGTTAYDESFNNNDADLGPGGATYVPTWVTGKFGSALDFDGNDDYIERIDADLNGPFPGKNSNGDVDFAVSAWIKLDTLDVRNPVASKQRDGTDPDRSWVFMVESNNKLRLQLAKNDSSTTDTDSIQTLDTDIWYHVAATYDYITDGTSEVRLYINGINDGNRDDVVGPLQKNVQPLNIGRYYWNGSTTYTIDGLIDDIRIYNYARTADEILVDYNNGVAAHLR